MSINSKIDKLILIYLYNKILYRDENMQTTADFTNTIWNERMDVTIPCV